MTLPLHLLAPASPRPAFPILIKHAEDLFLDGLSNLTI